MDVFYEFLNDFIKVCALFTLSMILSFFVLYILAYFLYFS